MRTLQSVVGMIAMVVATTQVGITASNPSVTSAQKQVVVTVLPGAGGNRPETLAPGELTVQQAKLSARVMGVERLTGDLAGMQLFVLLDDSTRSSSLGSQLRDLKAAFKSLPATTEIAIGYMRNGSVATTQTFTADHEKAAAALRLPMAIPGANGSPYFALADLLKHWPSKETTNRRAILMLTDGVDEYYSNAIMDDPYVDSAIEDALKLGVMVYSIYFRGSSGVGRGGRATNIAQSRLMEVSEETGGFAYFLGFSDPVSLSPFMKDLQARLENQYRVTIEATGEKGVQPIKLRTELPGLKIEAPTRIYLP